jgi:hypothetical protein
VRLLPNTVFIKRYSQLFTLRSDEPYIVKIESKIRKGYGSIGTALITVGGLTIKWLLTDVGLKANLYRDGLLSAAYQSSDK